MKAYFGMKKGARTSTETLLQASQESQVPGLSLTIEMVQMNANLPGSSHQRHTWDCQMKSVLRKLGSSEPQIMWTEHWNHWKSKATFSFYSKSPGGPQQWDWIEPYPRTQLREAAEENWVLCRSPFETLPLIDLPSLYPFVCLSSSQEVPRTNSDSFILTKSQERKSWLKVILLTKTQNQ